MLQEPLADRLAVLENLLVSVNSCLASRQENPWVKDLAYPLGQMTCPLAALASVPVDPSVLACPLAALASVPVDPSVLDPSVVALAALTKVEPSQPFLFQVVHSGYLLVLP